MVLKMRNPLFHDFRYIPYKDYTPPLKFEIPVGLRYSHFPKELY